MWTTPKPSPTAPRAWGFDTYFGISASLDMVPYCFIENDHVVANPTETMKLVMNKGGPVSYTREGPGSPGFRGEDVLPTFTREAKKVIEAGCKEGLALLSLPAAQLPPHAHPAQRKVAGKSGISLYGDFVMETDDAIGQIMRASEEAGIAKDTLIIVTSDNGCSPSADYPKLLAAGHNPSYNMRGHKADIFDGGHRVPFIVRRPAKVKGGQTSAQIVCLTDFMATAADVVGAKAAGERRRGQLQHPS